MQITRKKKSLTKSRKWSRCISEAGSILALDGDYYHIKERQLSPSSDTQALASDWRKVGVQIKSSMPTSPKKSGNK
jgi:hypothetical protein